MAWSAMHAPTPAPRIMPRHPAAWRAAVALLAAYVLFVQIFALAIAGASHAAALADPLAASICRNGDDAGHPSGDNGHGECLAPCAAICHGTTAAAAPDVSPALPPPVQTAMAVEIRAEAAPPARNSRPQPWPRGPPSKA